MMKKVKLITPTIHTGKLRIHGRIVYGEFSPTLIRSMAITLRVWKDKSMPIIKGIWDITKYTVAMVATVVAVMFMVIASAPYLSMLSWWALPFLVCGFLVVLMMIWIVWCTTPTVYDFTHDYKGWK